MDLFKWLWRGVLVIVVLFFGIALALLTIDGSRILQTQIREILYIAPVELRVELVDQVNGLIEVNYDVDLQRLTGILEDYVEPPNYPLELRLCLKSFRGFYRQAVDCDSVWMEEPLAVTGLAFVSKSYYLPNNQRDFDLEIDLEIYPSGAESIVFTGKTDRLKWKPRATVQDLGGNRLSSVEMNYNQNIVMVVSRWKELDIFWNTEPAKTQQITDPETIHHFINVEEETVPQYSWLISIPGTVNDSAPGELCLDLAAEGRECFRFSVKAYEDEVPVEEELKAAAPVEEVTEELVEIDEEELIEEIEEIVEEDIVIVEEYLELSENLSVLLPARKFTNENMTFSGHINAGFARVCLVALDDGEIISGKYIVPNEDGSFYDSFIGQELLLGKYAVLIFTDSQEECPVLLEEWLHKEERSPMPVIIEMVAVDEGVDVLEVRWLGTDLTEVDPMGRRAVDFSTGGGNFETRVQIRTFFAEEVKIYVLVDEKTTFTHTLAPDTEDELLVKMKEFDYGRHNFLIYAVLPDGQKTADVVIPFEYVAAHFTAITLAKYQLWQLAGVGVLVFLGAMYLWLKVGRVIWRTRSK